MSGVAEKLDYDPFVVDDEAEAKTQQFRRAAVLCRDMAAQLLEEVAALLSDQAAQCECCGTTRFLNFPQKALRDRVCGASDRLSEIAGALERRARDREFLGLPLSTVGGVEL